MVAAPEDYIWSSAQRWRTASNPYPWLDDIPFPQEFGLDALAQKENYLRFVRETVPDGEWELIRGSVKRSQLTGDDRFVTEVEQILGKRIEHRKQGRLSGGGK
jgi:putative transposase